MSGLNELLFITLSFIGFQFCIGGEHAIKELKRLNKGKVLIAVGVVFFILAGAVVYLKG